MADVFIQVIKHIQLRTRVRLINDEIAQTTEKLDACIAQEKSNLSEFISQEENRKKELTEQFNATRNRAIRCIHTGLLKSFGFGAASGYLILGILTLGSVLFLPPWNLPFILFLTIDVAIRAFGICAFVGLRKIKIDMPPAPGKLLPRAALALPLLGAVSSILVAGMIYLHSDHPRASSFEIQFGGSATSETISITSSEAAVTWDKPNNSWIATVTVTAPVQLPLRYAKRDDSWRDKDIFIVAVDGANNVTKKRYHLHINEEDIH